MMFLLISSAQEELAWHLWLQNMPSVHVMQVHVS